MGTVYIRVIAVFLLTFTRRARGESIVYTRVIDGFLFSILKIEFKDRFLHGYYFYGEEVCSVGLGTARSK